MSRKRRMFDIDVPEGTDDAHPIPEGIETKSARRGPMATAIGEAGAATRRRADIEAEIRAENDGLARELVRLKKAGLVVDLIDVASVRAQRLTRDRAAAADLDLADLKASLRDIGLSNPIRVAPDGAGGYELVQGLRRLSAYRELLAETGDAAWARIPAGILAAGEDEAALYRRMVDENLIRKDVSFAEMAALARGYASDGVGGCTSLDEAVNALYGSVSPQKRSYVRRFASLLSKIDKLLDHPAALSRDLGLALADVLDADPVAVRRIGSALSRLPGRTPEQEVAILREVAADPGGTRAKARTAPRPSRRGRVALTVPVGPGLRCTATDGRMELRADVDFGAMDRARLEAAVEAFWAALEA